VGNSRIKLGAFRVSGDAPLAECPYFLARPLDGVLPWDDIRQWLPGEQPPLVIAGSNPRVIDRVADEWQSTTGRTAWVLRDRSQLPLIVDVESPDKVGLDRLLNAVAANLVRRPDRPLIVVDSGTATTVDLVTTDGRFAGGAILPGFALSAAALHEYTALLPQLSLGDLGPDVPAAVGRHTVAALRSGIYWGQVGAIERLIRELDQDQPAASQLILTGGGAVWLTQQFPHALTVPSLALHGLVATAWSLGLGAS
jgi:type III pantothenate kinase